MGKLEGTQPPIFERAHLRQYVEHNQDLEREIVDLFLVQLPEILRELHASADGKDWRLWTHTLKGSAMAVGARRIEQAARELEDERFYEDSADRQSRLAALTALVAEFRGEAGHLLA